MNHDKHAINVALMKNFHVLFSSILSSMGKSHETIFSFVDVELHHYHYPYGHYLWKELKINCYLSCGSSLNRYSLHHYHYVLLSILSKDFHYCFGKSLVEALEDATRFLCKSLRLSTPDWGELFRQFNYPRSLMH